MTKETQQKKHNKKNTDNKNQHLFIKQTSQYKSVCLTHILNFKFMFRFADTLNFNSVRSASHLKLLLIWYNEERDRQIQLWYQLYAEKHKHNLLVKRMKDDQWWITSIQRWLKITCNRSRFDWSQIIQHQRRKSNTQHICDWMSWFWSAFW